MKKNTIFLPILLLVFSSFFWSADEEKQLRNLHQNAEAAIKKHDFEEAKTSYEELISRIGVNTTQKYCVDWPAYVDIVLRFTEACEAVGDCEEGEKALTRLLMKNPPIEQQPRIKLMRARLNSTLKSPGDAYREMQSVTQTLPEEAWKKEDRSFFYALQYSLDSHYDALGRKAKRYLVTGFYNEAITLYEEILHAIDVGQYPKALLNDSLVQKKIRYRLAESFYAQANYEQTLALCYNKEAVEDRIDREMIYLSALCYREKKEYEKALAFLQSYAKSGTRDDLEHYDHALFEIGLFYYQAANYPRARQYFEQLQQSKGKPKIVAALYLARMHLRDGNPQAVENLVAALARELSTDDPLCYECYYLRGEAAYALGDYAHAKTLFEKSFPKKRASGKWTDQALLHLGWCYARLAEDPTISNQTREAYFSRAEEMFTKLFGSQEETAILALGRLNILRWQYLEDEAALKRVSSLLLPYQTVDALLLRAEAAESYEEKEELYSRATSEVHNLNPSYAEAWYARGLNHFQEGLKNPANGGPLFELAATAFGRAFKIMERGNFPKAAHILKLEAQANAYRNSPISSLALLEKLLNEFSESVEEREETLYLRGIIASQLLDLSYFPIAEESLCQVACGNGKYHDEALFALGMLYFGQEYYEKAKETFLTLANESPRSTFICDVWFWAAEAAEKNGDADHGALRARVYQEHPLAPRAAEAYFRQFSYESYLEGNATALAHLRDFTSRFPNSPLLVVVHYLIGTNEEHFSTAKARLEEAIKAFPLCLEEGKSVDTAYVYFRYQAMLELAQLYLENKTPEEALPLLNAITKDFSLSDHPYASLLLQKSPYPSLYEEAEYTLVQAYLKTGKRMRAQERLAKMLAHFEEAGIEEGYYLSAVWREQGKLAQSCRDYDTALHCFEIANACGNGYLSEEQKLNLWLLQSNAYRGKKEYETAMRLLSKVINTDIASPLRLKAMFLRAEVYELQGRPELAVRQLEAMAKKGGDWACLAQEKLRHEYGM